MNKFYQMLKIFFIEASLVGVLYTSYLLGSSIIGLFMDTSKLNIFVISIFSAILGFLTIASALILTFTALMAIVLLVAIVTIPFMHEDKDVVFKESSK